MLNHDSFHGVQLQERFLSALDRYALHHIETGGFLRAVLENDLKESFGRADTRAAEQIPALVGYAYNELPSLAWGSPERVKAWLAERVT